MDRSVLESDPHRVLEGMADRRVTRSARPKATSTCAPNIRWRSSGCATRNPAGRALGLLGNEHLRHPFQLPHRHSPGRRRIRLRRRDGADRVGRREARHAAPASAVSRHRKACSVQPTLINNVETYANIAPIIRNGGEWYAQIGTEKSKGTKVFALAGRVQNTGLDRSADGHHAARDRISRSAAAFPTDATSRRCRPAVLRAAAFPPSTSTCRSITNRWPRSGSIMGSGGMIVMDETSCMVDVAKYFMDFCMTESCGKCIPCRVGTYQMHRTSARRSPTCEATAQRSDPAGGTLRPGEAHQPVRARPVGAESRWSARCVLRRTSTGRISKITQCPAGVCGSQAGGGDSHEARRQSTSRR